MYKRITTHTHTHKHQKISDDWRKSTLVSIYKNKGYTHNCTDYFGIKLTSHATKL